MSDRVDNGTMAWPLLPPAGLQERVRLALYGAGGRLMLTDLRKRVRHMTTMDLNNTVNAMMDKGMVTLEHEPKGLHPGRPRTWINLVPVVDPVGPVVASAAWLAYTDEEEP